MLEKIWNSIGKKDVELVKCIDPLWNGHRPFFFKALHGQEHEFEDGIIAAILGLHKQLQKNNLQEFDH